MTNNRKREMQYGQMLLSVLVFGFLMAFLVVAAGSCQEREKTIKVQL